MLNRIWDSLKKPYQPTLVDENVVQYNKLYYSSLFVWFIITFFLALSTSCDFISLTYDYWGCEKYLAVQDEVVTLTKAMPEVRKPGLAFKMSTHREWIDKYDDIKHFNFYFNYFAYEVNRYGINVYDQDYGAYEGDSQILKAIEGLIPPKFEFVIRAVEKECNFVLDNQFQIQLRNLNETALTAKQITANGTELNCVAVTSALDCLSAFKVEPSTFEFNKGFRCKSCFHEFPGSISLGACLQILLYYVASFGPFETIVFFLIEYANKSNNMNEVLKKVGLANDEDSSLPSHQQVQAVESEPMLRMRNPNAGNETKQERLV